MLGSYVSSHEQNVKVKAPDEHNDMFDKWYPHCLRTNGDSFLEGYKSLDISKIIKSFFQASNLGEGKVHSSTPKPSELKSSY